MAAGWEPSTAALKGRTPAELAAVGIDYVEVKPRWGMVFFWLGLIGLGLFLLRSERG